MVTVWKDVKKLLMYPAALVFNRAVVDQGKPATEAPEGSNPPGISLIPNHVRDDTHESIIRWAALCPGRDLRPGGESNLHTGRDHDGVDAVLGADQSAQCCASAVDAGAALSWDDFRGGA